MLFIGISKLIATLSVDERVWLLHFHEFFDNLDFHEFFKILKISHSLTAAQQEHVVSQQFLLCYHCLP